MRKAKVELQVHQWIPLSKNLSVFIWCHRPNLFNDQIKIYRASLKATIVHRKKTMEFEELLYRYHKLMEWATLSGISKYIISKYGKPCARISTIK